MQVNIELKCKVYLFFSHTIKGQKENMPLLKKIMDSGSTLIDYERIADADPGCPELAGRSGGIPDTRDLVSGPAYVFANGNLLPWPVGVTPTV